MFGELIAGTLFTQLVAILVVATTIGFAAVKCKQPLIVAFIVAGILAGPEGFDLVRGQDAEIIETLAQFGIALLLFMVGLKLDLGLIRKTGTMALIAGTVQVALTFFFGFALSFAFGFSVAASAFMGLALAFSSTIIAVKLLSDRRAVDSLYGRLALGILIVQDFIVIFVTIIIAGLGGASGEDVFNIAGFLAILAKAFMLIVVIGLFIRYLAEGITRMLARNAELMVVFSIAFAVLMAALCEYLGFGQELGGLLAGVALASSAYNNVIAARMTALRDFLLLFFFTHLGAHMSFEGIGQNLMPALALSVFVLVGKPFLIMGILHVLRFRKRTGFMAGLSLSQISEFSLVLVSMGFGMGLIEQDALNVVTLIGLITMALSTYAIIYDYSVYSFLERYTGLFAQGATDNVEEEDHVPQEQFDLVIFGLGRYGNAMARVFQRKGYRVLGVDFDPEAIARAREEGIYAKYSDASDPEVASDLPLEGVTIVIFTFHHYMTGPLIVDLRRTLARTLRHAGYKGYIAATTHIQGGEEDLASHGVDLILRPYEDAALHGAEQMLRVLGMGPESEAGQDQPEGQSSPA